MDTTNKQITKEIELMYNKMVSSEHQEVKKLKVKQEKNVETKTKRCGL